MIEIVGTVLLALMFQPSQLVSPAMPTEPHQPDAMILLCCEAEYETSSHVTPVPKVANPSVAPKRLFRFKLQDASLRRPVRIIMPCCAVSVLKLVSVG